MITNVSMTNFKPSFGFARLDEKGRAGADMLNYRNNTLHHRDTRPYDKPSFLHSYKKMPLASLMAAGHTFEEICKKFNASKYYLSHIFKEITGQTIISHLNFVRCKHAKSLLKSGNYNVSESAYKSGFNNLSYFSKTYKSIMGNLPIKDLKST